MELTDEILPVEALTKPPYDRAMRTVMDPSWRRRVGLPAVKLGGRIVGFYRADVARALRREFMPETTCC